MTRLFRCCWKMTQRGRCACQRCTSPHGRMTPRPPPSSCRTTTTPTWSPRSAPGLRSQLCSCCGVFIACHFLPSVQLFCFAFPLSTICVASPFSPHVLHDVCSDFGFLVPLKQQCVAVTATSRFLGNNRKDFSPLLVSFETVQLRRVEPPVSDVDHVEVCVCVCITSVSIGFFFFFIFSCLILVSPHPAAWWHLLWLLLWLLWCTNRPHFLLLLPLLLPFSDSTAFSSFSLLLPLDDGE